MNLVETQARHRDRAVRFLRAHLDVLQREGVEVKARHDRLGHLEVLSRHDLVRQFEDLAAEHAVTRDMIPRVEAGYLTPHEAIIEIASVRGVPLLVEFMRWRDPSDRSFGAFDAILGEAING